MHTIAAMFLLALVEEKEVEEGAHNLTHGSLLVSHGPLLQDLARFHVWLRSAF